jgi:predicted Zn-dependent protease
MSIRNTLRNPSCIFGGIAVLAILGYGCTVVQNLADKVGPGAGNFVRDISTAHDAGKLGDADEDELGKSVAILLTNRYEPTRNEKLVQYVNLVGYTLVSCSSKPDGHYAFGVLDTDDIGAYSGPNGYVMVTRGALQAMRDEGELAGVLAHELTHVIDHHGLDSAKHAAAKAGYMDATKMILPVKDVTGFIDSTVDAVVRNGYDKPQEDEADAGAVKLLIATGYDPRSYAHFLSHIAALQEAAPRPTTQPDGTTTIVKQIMSTHPGIPDRLQNVLKEIAEANVNGGATMPDRFKTYVMR